MKRLLVLLFALVAVACAPLAFSTASAASQQDLIQDSQCKAGQNSACVGTISDPAASGECRDDNCNVVNKYLNPFIQFLSVMVGVAVIIGIIVSGIQYAASSGDPQKVSTAKNRIRNSIVALIAFIFLYALLQFLIPGQGLLID